LPEQKQFVVDCSISQPGASGEFCVCVFVFEKQASIRVSNCFCKQTIQSLLLGDMAKKNAGESSPPPLSKPNSGLSTIQLFMLCVTILGMGIIGGYVVFSRIHSTRCLDLLDSVESKHKDSSSEWQRKYLQTVEELDRCRDDVQQRALLETNQGSADQLSMIQDKLAAEQRKTQRLRRQIEHYQENLRQSDKNYKNCEQSKEMMKQMIEDNRNEANRNVEAEL